MALVYSPISNSSSRSVVLTRYVQSAPRIIFSLLTDLTARLFTDLITDSLSESSYDADMAGLSYHCVSHTKGMFVTLQGYNDKMSVLVQHVLDKVKNLKVLTERMNVMVEQVCLCVLCSNNRDLTSNLRRINKAGKTSTLDSRISFQNTMGGI